MKTRKMSRRIEYLNFLIWIGPSGKTIWGWRERRNNNMGSAILWTRHLRSASYHSSNCILPAPAEGYKASCRYWTVSSCLTSSFAGKETGGLQHLKHMHRQTPSTAAQHSASLIAHLATPTQPLIHSFFFFFTTHPEHAHISHAVLWTLDKNILDSAEDVWWLKVDGSLLASSICTRTPVLRFKDCLTAMKFSVLWWVRKYRAKMLFAALGPL